MGNVAAKVIHYHHQWLRTQSAQRKELLVRSPLPGDGLGQLWMAGESLTSVPSQWVSQSPEFTLSQ